MHYQGEPIGDKQNSKTYEIGLVMAGAVSAGAYTAGVLDYLLEALESYESMRKEFELQNEGKELHQVKIRVISGASAGGICGSLVLSSMMDASYQPLSNYHPNKELTQEQIDNNVFYRT